MTPAQDEPDALSRFMIRQHGRPVQTVEADDVMGAWLAWGRLLNIGVRLVRQPEGHAVLDHPMLGPVASIYPA